MDFLNKENIGKEYKDFVLLSIDDLCDYHTKAVYLRHKYTGLEVYHILKEDKENLFAFAFRTLAKNSKGIAHIMEHSVLCGSQKFPLKEPFVTLENQSVKTFLNAMTYPEKTVYPASSIIPSDYFNLMDVYADAVFFPLITEETFRQEGHRFEIEQDGSLSIQGVVFNEMKGVYSSFDSVAYRELTQSLYPDSYHAWNSGGDPLEIVKLSYQEFCDFHKKFYTPSNCLLFLYGDIPTTTQLDFLSEKYIPRLQKKYNCYDILPHFQEKLPLLDDEIKSLLKTNKISFENSSADEFSPSFKIQAPDSGTTGSNVQLCWYSGKYDIEKYYLMELICGNDSSPLAKKLKDANLGDDFVFSCGDDSEEGFLSVGLLGVKKGKENQVYSLIQKSMTEVFNEEIKQEDIDSAIMGLDFSLREIYRSHGPYSLDLMSSVLKGWETGLNPNKYLSPISDFEKVKEKIKNDATYTKSLIQKYFFADEKPIFVTIEPSKTYLIERNKKEAEFISKAKKTINIEELKQKNDLLHAYQQKEETEEELKCIPYLKVSDLTDDVEITKITPYKIALENNDEIFVCKNVEDTNGIIYFTVAFPLDNLPAEDYKHLRMFSKTLTNMGWNNKNWADCTTECARIMGDVWGTTKFGTVPNCEESKKLAEERKSLNVIGLDWLGISCKFLEEKAAESLDLLAEIITTMNFSDKKRLDTLMTEFKQAKKQSLVPSGMNYALKRASAFYHRYFAIDEVMNGVSQIKTLDEYTKKQIPHFVKKFQTMYDTIINSGATIQVLADEKGMHTIENLLNDFAKKAKLKPIKESKQCSKEELIQMIFDNSHQNISREIVNIPSLVGYSATVFPSSSFLSKESIAEGVLANWLSGHSLWDKIRTMGGAYGGGAFNNSIEEVVSFYSYRDPTPNKSLDVYLEVLKEVSEKGISKEDLERTIISIYGMITTPKDATGKASSSISNFMYAVPDNQSQRKIQLLVQITNDDVKAAAQRLYKKMNEERHEVLICDKSINSSGKKLDIVL